MEQEVAPGIRKAQLDQMAGKPAEFVVCWAADDSEATGHCHKAGTKWMWKFAHRLDSFAELGWVCGDHAEEKNTRLAFEISRASTAIGRG